MQSQMSEGASTPTNLLYAALRFAEVDFFASVPCKLLGDLITILQADDSIVYTPVSREEEGVGLAAGAFLAGKHPALVMQNSGVGNCINAMMALLRYYRIPVVFVISHRGSEGEPIEAQRLMGGIMSELLKLTDVEVLDLQEPAMLAGVPEAIRRVRAERRSIALLLPFSFWTIKA